MTKTITTHNSGFHADDVFAVATLSIVLKDDYKIVRTRDPKLIEESDYVVDVGIIYDSETNRFDHHQIGGAGERNNGIPYASFGLVWKHYGEKVAGSKEVRDAIDKTLVQPIDAKDNGVDISTEVIKGVQDFSMSHVITTFIPTWMEKDKDIDDAFKEAVEFATNILLNQINIETHNLEAINFIKSVYDNSEDKRIIFLDEKDPSFKAPSFGRKVVTKALLKYEEPLYTVFYKPDIDAWQVAAVNKDETTYETRKPFPELWRGKRDEELAKVSGIRDAYFCHSKGFMCMVKSKEGAIALAKKALQA